MGVDAGSESVTLLDTTAARIDLNSWRLADTTSRQDLGGVLEPGSTLRVRLGAMHLGNRGDNLMLIDPEGKVVDQVAYMAKEVRPGRTIAFGR